jgi:hypothetical protein
MGSLDKRAKEAVLSQMEDLGEITTESVMELIRPHYIFDPIRIKERELRRKANSLMSQFKDDHGMRTCYNYKDVDGESVYINVDETKDLRALNRVKKQINSKFNGLHKAKKKIDRRSLELSGQIGLFDKVAEG